MHEILAAVLYQQQFTAFGKPLFAVVSGYGFLILLTLAYVYKEYIRQIFTRKVPPPISVWGLWLLLDVVATASELARGIFNIQLVGFTIGTAFVCLALIRRRVIEWDILWDSAAAVLVVIAIVLLLTTNDPTLGLLCSLFGMTVASLPLVRSVVSGGADESLLIWCAILIGSILSIFDGNTISGVWLGLTQIGMIYLIYRNQQKQVCLT